MRRQWRLQKLEQQAAVEPAWQAQRSWVAEEWLGYYEDLGEEGHFAGEPDFPEALAQYQALLERLAAQPDPPFYPPDDYLVGQELGERIARWRSRYNYPGLDAALCWLGAMHKRVDNGEPPVTAVAFAELADWFDANARALYQISMPTQLLDLDNGRRTTTADLRNGIWNGPRCSRAGAVLADLRRVRDLYGERCQRLRMSAPCS